MSFISHTPPGRWPLRVRSQGSKGIRDPDPPPSSLRRLSKAQLMKWGSCTRSLRCRPVPRAGHPPGSHQRETPQPPPNTTTTVSSKARRWGGCSGLALSSSSLGCVARPHVSRFATGSSPRDRASQTPGGQHPSQASLAGLQDSIAFPQTPAPWSGGRFPGKSRDIDARVMGAPRASGDHTWDPSGTRTPRAWPRGP